MIPRYVQTQAELDHMESVSFRTIEDTLFTREPRVLVIETPGGKVCVTAAEMGRFLDWYERNQK